MKLIDIFSLEWYSTPWHIIYSDINNSIYVSLSGDATYSDNNNIATAGIICLTFNGEIIEEKWSFYSKEFQALHGIDISNDGKKIYISGRGDDKLYVFGAEEEELLNSFYLIENAMSGGIKVY